MNLPNLRQTAHGTSALGERKSTGSNFKLSHGRKIGIFEKNGEACASLAVIAAHVLALRQPPKERKAKPKPSAATNAPGGRADFDDGFPDDFGGRS